MNEILIRPMNEPFEVKIDSLKDTRGALSFLQSSSNFPFNIERVYWLYDVPNDQIRGGHAHKTSQQVIVCLHGEIEVYLESQNGEEFHILLNQPNIGLYIPPMWWGTMEFRQSAILMGLASDEFAEEDYIRNKQDFK